MRSKINKEMKIGFTILSFYMAWAFFWLIQKYILKGSLLSPYSISPDITSELISPSFSTFLLGTDLYGRSLLEVLSNGLIYSLGVSISVSVISGTIGIIIGYISVTGHRTVQFFTDLLINLIFVFPSILIAILVMSLSGQSFWGLVFALVITGWPGYARIARGETKRVMGLSFVEASRAIGMSKVRMFFTVVLPSILPLIMIHLILGISGVIISEAALGFLGLGGSEYSWGALLSTAKTVLLEAPHMVIVLSLSMAGLIIGLNLFGDGLRDYLDPQNKE